MKISVVICAFNHAQFIENSINSVLNQGYRDFELVIINDGSNDETGYILKKYESIALVINKKNEGQVSGYNLGLSMCTGDVVVFLDADDFIHSDCLEAVAEVMKDESCVKAHWRMSCINEEGGALGVTIPTKLSTGCVGDKLINLGWLYYSSPGSGNAYRISTLRRFFPLPILQEDKHGADFFCIYAVALFGRVVEIKRTLGSYRVMLKKGALNSAIFGNAAAVNSEPRRQIGREKAFLQWINSLDIDCPKIKSSHLISIPTLKLKISAFYSSSDFSITDRDYWIYFKLMMKCFVVDGERTLYERSLIFFWVCFTLIMPVRLRKISVRYACNPLSR